MKRSVFFLKVVSVTILLSILLEVVRRYVAYAVGSEAYGYAASFLLAGSGTAYLLLRRTRGRLDRESEAYLWAMMFVTLSFLVLGLKCLYPIPVVRSESPIYLSH